MECVLLRDDNKAEVQGRIQDVVASSVGVVRQIAGSHPSIKPTTASFAKG
jgi:hypothetical protein